jgi:hypothetical protein
MRTMIYHVTHKKAGWTIDVHLNGLYVADVKYGNEPFLQKKRDTVCEAVKAAAIEQNVSGVTQDTVLDCGDLAFSYDGIVAW